MENLNKSKSAHADIKTLSNGSEASIFSFSWGALLIGPF